ncbi:hypothetical protein F8M41_015086 [Gigaspora margarita]|uniref:Uncharacterized protein n=1 Tax=Gigaspora margarita TaxID=4874 RepID=A0A8H4AQX1_GIGMA|nr:hypothetical protein F8M41_015086 [Gigaspora margarita]
MSSVFTAFCFIKTISGNNKFVTGTALYRIDEDNEFREITYKGFTGTAETLISDFEKNLIVLIIGRYIYQDNIEYVCLVQTIPVFSFHNGSACTPNDLPYAFPLLMYSAPTITNSYKANDNVGRQSFMLSKKLYNPVTGQKAINSDVIVSYTNSYPSNESQSSSLIMNAKLKTHKELNSQLDLIEEQYSTRGSRAFKRRKGLTPFASATTIPTSPLSATNTSTLTFLPHLLTHPLLHLPLLLQALLSFTSTSAPATANSSISTSTTICSPMPNPPNIDPSNRVSQILENEPTPQNSSNNLPNANNKLNE